MCSGPRLLSLQDCVKAIRSYVKLMLKPKDKATEILGMKALLVDDETVGAATNQTVCNGGGGCI